MDLKLNSINLNSDCNGLWTASDQAFLFFFCFAYCSWAIVLMFWLEFNKRSKLSAVEGVDSATQANQWAMAALIHVGEGFFKEPCSRFMSTP